MWNEDFALRVAAFFSCVIQDKILISETRGNNHIFQDLYPKANSSKMKAQLNFLLPN